MDDLTDETKEKYRRWWMNRSPEERARLRAFNGQSVTPHEIVFLADSDGFPLAAGRDATSDPTAVFTLPDFLLAEEGAGPARADPGDSGTGLP